MKKTVFHVSRATKTGKTVNVGDFDTLFMKIIEFLKAVKKIPSWDRTPAISDEDLEALINQIDMTKEVASSGIQSARTR